jgi:outer membrane murein-binding lipoprotein Lpp
MLRAIAKLAFLILLAASVCLNVLALAGCFHRDLIREKDALIDRFERRVTDLAQANRRLTVTLDVLEKTLSEYAAVNARTGREITAIREKYEKISAGGQP